MSQTPAVPDPAGGKSDVDALTRADRPPERTDVSNLHAAIMREQNDPRDGYEPVPLWLVTLFGAILFWGGWYVATYSGGWRGDVLDEDPAARYAAMAGGGGAPAPLDPFALGKRIYSGNCVSCHQADGRGVPGQYPPLAGSNWVNEPSPARLKRILLSGMEGPVQVNGATYNGSMPNFGLKLKDEQIAAVLTYVRTNTDWGNSASPVTAESVAATRAAVGTRVLPWSPQELMAVTDDEGPAVREASSLPASAPSTGAW